MAEAYGKLPLRFEANRGQTSGEVKFVARGGGYTLFLTPSEAVLSLRRPGAVEAVGETPGASVAQTADTLRVRLGGSNPSPVVVGVGELPGRSNYLLGEDARAWRTNVPNFEKVRYGSVYPGVDLVYYGEQGQLEYDFLVAPGADPRRIRLKFEGARAVRVDEQGDLVLGTRGGDVRQRKPFASQEVDGARREVAARYVKKAGGAIRATASPWTPQATPISSATPRRPTSPSRVLCARPSAETATPSSPRSARTPTSRLRTPTRATP
jgi:hypothetical protein